MTNKMWTAICDLEQRLRSGQEWPDAHAAVACLYGIDGDTLTGAYDDNNQWGEGE